MNPADVLAFWREAGPGRWFRKDDAFDAQFRERFMAAHESAAAGALAGWEAEAGSCLALLILLDQFPRNAFRGSARMFATDAAALAVAHRALERQFDQQTEQALRNFFYLPFMHAESVADQELAVRLATPLGADALRFAVLHQDIILRFGRFPHRNALLGRASTAEEIRFLAEGGFAG